MEENPDLVEYVLVHVAGIASISVGVRQSWNFDGRYRPSLARAIEDVEAHPANVQLIEKELKFSPMFNVYVKIVDYNKKAFIPNFCGRPKLHVYIMQQLINKICKVAKKPLVVTYTGLIQACLDSGNVENGTYIFNQMHKFCSPNTVACNIMLKSYIEHGMYNEAKDLFWKILDGNHQIKNKVDSDQKAIPDKFTLNTMMEACALTNNWDDFESSYKQMLHHGYHFDMKRHLHMVLDASRAGKGARQCVTIFGLDNTSYSLEL